MPSVEKRLLSIPFAKGLSQREDPRWLAPGALITGQNAVHPKTSIVAKRPGTQLLPTTGVASVPGIAVALTSGKRLGSLDGSLVAIGQDAFGDAAWTFSEVPNGAESTVTPVFRDRVPEVYALPSRVLAGGAGVVLDMDSCLCNGWLVHVWLVGIATAAGAPAPGCDIYYQVESASTGKVLIAAQSAHLVPSVGAVAPKIVACGTTAILTFATGAGASPTANDNSIFAAALDLTNPTHAWSVASKVTAVPDPPFSLTGGTAGTGSYLGTYDLDSVLGDTAHFVVACGTGTATTTNHITLFKCSVAATLAGAVTSTSGNVDSGDAIWTSDGATHHTLTAIAIRADSTNNEILVSYGWNTSVLGAGGTTRVSTMLALYTTLAVSATAVNLMNTVSIVSPNPSPTDVAPQWIAVDRILDGSTVLYKTYFSPGSCFLDEGQNGGTGQATAYIANYITQVVGGAMNVNTWSPRVTYGVRLASRTIQRNGIGYVIGYLPSRTQGSYFLFADDAWNDLATEVAFPFRLVGNIAPRLASGPAIFFFQNTVISNQPPASSFTLPHLVPNALGPGGDVVYTLLSVTQGQATVTEPSVFAFDFKSALSHQMAQLGENLMIASACPSAFDGERAFELGFPYWPLVLSAAQSSGGFLTASATYNYLVTFEKRDAAGQRHRSGRSVAFSVTLTAGMTKLTLKVTTMGFTAREKCAAPVAGQGPQGLSTPGSAVIIKVFRTLANGTEYFCLDQIDYVSGGGDDSGTGTAATNNNAGVAFVTIVDAKADSGVGGIATNELVYDDGSDGTQPGSILDNLCGPGMQGCCVHQGRPFFFSGSDVWPCKAFAQGEGSGFNEVMNFTLDDGPGDITALASMDGNLILFKRDRVYYMTGFGPNDSGGASDWSPPQRIASDVGAIDWRGVVVTPNGCWFMSDAGLRLLTRDLQVTNETNVEDLLNTNYLMSSGVIHPTRNRVLWTANTDDVSVPRTGIGLDHDYVLDSWMSSVSVDAGSAVEGAVSAVVASALVTGTNEPTYHWLRAGGVVCRETPGQYLDGTVYVPMTIETAWIKSEGLENFARFRRLMVTWQNNDPHQLSVYVAYDYSSTYVLMGTVTAAQMLAMTTPLCQELFALPRQRAEAVRFKIVDAVDLVTPPVTGQGPTLVSLGLEYGAYTNRRLARLPSAQRT